MKKFLLLTSVLLIFGSSFAQKKKADKYFTKGLYAKAIPLYSRASQKAVITNRKV